MTDGSIAERRRVLGFPSEDSRHEEYLQALRDYVYHDSKVQELGRYKGFFHIIERARLAKVIDSYGYED